MKKVAKGFTLVELMIVVAIIGILAAIAIPNFVKYQLRTKASEAGMLIESLRKAEAALISDPRPIVWNGALAPNYSQNQFWDLNAVKLPAAGVPGTAKLNWVTGAAGDVSRALAMDWAPEGQTYYDYMVTVAGCPGVPATANSGVCFQVGASADIDGDGVPAFKTLIRPSTANVVPGANPGNIAAAAFGTLGGTCGAAAATAVFNTYCSYTGPDTF